ncbi:MAG: hypothetical protein ACI3ZK_01615 [Candidatus Cryptobacteroides sp.]
MSANYSSKHGIVGRSPMELFMLFTDLRNFEKMVPANIDASISADFDHLSASMKGISIGVRVAERLPYSKIVFESEQSPFDFRVTVNLTELGGNRTDFSIDFDAQLNGIYKMLIGNKINQALDQIVDSLVQASAHI